MKYVVILLGCIAVLFVLFYAIRRANSPFKKSCFQCGSEARFGYSEHAEEYLEKIKPMCINCLADQLEKDYTGFTGKAVVIQPAGGLPVYVYQPIKEWQKHFKESKIGADVNLLLSKMESHCHDCGQKANYLWIESDGLTFKKTLDDGISATLLLNNPSPVSLCAKCAVRHISRDMRDQHLSYIEVSSPSGDGNGFVIPMAY